MRIEATRTGEEVFAALTVEAFRDLGPRGDHLTAEWTNQIDHLRGLYFPRTPSAYTFGAENLGEVYVNEKLRRAGESSEVL